MIQEYGNSVVATEPYGTSEEVLWQKYKPSLAANYQQTRKQVSDGLWPEEPTYRYGGKQPHAVYVDCPDCNGQGCDDCYYGLVYSHSLVSLSDNLLFWYVAVEVS